MTGAAGAYASDTSGGISSDHRTGRMLGTVEAKSSSVLEAASFVSVTP